MGDIYIFNRKAKRQQAARKRAIEKKAEVYRKKRVGELVGDGVPDFSSVSLSDLCSSIQLLINEAIRRGCPIYDFDNKKKSLQQIQILGNKVYFFAAEEEQGIEKEKADEGI